MSQISNDIVQTSDFDFAPFGSRIGDSGKLLLATRWSDEHEKYIVKHTFADCACNEFIYTKLTQAMGYPMPDAVLFRFSPGETRQCFRTEYIIGERFLNVVNDHPKYEDIRAKASNWTDYFAFAGMYAMTDEGDGMEVVLADDGLIYRVDTADAFPITEIMIRALEDDRPGSMLGNWARQTVQADSIRTFDPLSVDCELEQCVKLDPGCVPYFLEPFKRIQEIGEDYIDEVLDTLACFYSEEICEFFRRYIAALKAECKKYLIEKR